MSYSAVWSVHEIPRIYIIVRSELAPGGLNPQAHESYDAYEIIQQASVVRNTIYML